MAYDVVSFGESMLRLSPPEGTRLEEARSLEVYVAGAESNVLCCLARLGLRCAWASALPRSSTGGIVARDLAGHGVGLEHVVWAPPDARLGTYYVEESPAPLGTRVQYDRAHSALAELDPSVLDPSFLDTARLLHLTGITPALGARPREILRRLLARASDRGVPVSFDVNYRAKLWDARAAAAELETTCEAADVLLCTRDDATELWGLEGEPEAVLRRMRERFRGGKPDKAVVLTLGSEGSAHLSAEGYARAPAYPSAGTSRLGSGDAFTAGYLYAHLGGPRYLEARRMLDITPLHFGNAVAALKRCIVGDIAVVAPEEVLGVLRGGEAARFR